MAWKELRHNGVAFPPPYEPRRLSIRIHGTVVQLSPEAEELAYAWGKKRTTPYIQDPVFQANFLSDFLKLLPSNFANAKYSEIDFTPVYEYQAKEELQKQDLDFKKKTAAQRKELRLSLKEKYGFAEIDGVKTEIANWMVEPPSLFMGRGSHPMRGRWKPRILPEDVVLNFSEKVEDEADTVGASTLRVEHLKFLPHGVEFDFLGKDSVRWQKILKVDGANTPIRKNLQEFSQGKRPEDLVFDGITSQHVNRFLNKAMRGLTAKGFRTHHATETVQTYLRRHNGFKGEESPYVKLHHARVANLEAAIRCNHKRTPPKTWEGSLLKKQQRLDELKTKEVKTDMQKMRLEERIRKLKLDVDLQKRTRDYNLNTSLRNYIDPRVYKNWANKAEFDWKGIYPKTLQRKFLWASRAKA